VHLVWRSLLWISLLLGFRKNVIYELSVYEVMESDLEDGSLLSQHHLLTLQYFLVSSRYRSF
jgi:hypothetical protein